MLVVVLLAAVGYGWGQDGLPALQYERRALAAGQLWRLITAHLVHLNAWHAVLNLAGLGLLTGLFPRSYTALEWLAVALASALAIDAGLWFGDPWVEWYVGLSGVLHGVLAAGAIAWWRAESRTFAALLSLILTAKLAYEQTRGPLPFSGSLPVVVDAHLYGAIGGAITALAIIKLRRRPAESVNPGADGPG
jgi:rhomboid family GlyGly-CTERM serine protease